MHFISLCIGKAQRKLLRNNAKLKYFNVFRFQ